MAKACEGPKLFKTQSGASRVSGGASIPEHADSTEVELVPWSSHALLVLRLPEGASQIPPRSTEPDFQTLPRSATDTETICLPDKPGRDQLIYSSSGWWLRSECPRPLLPAGGGG